MTKMSGVHTDNEVSAEDVSVVVSSDNESQSYSITEMLGELYEELSSTLGAESAIEIFDNFGIAIDMKTDDEIQFSTTDGTGRIVLYASALIRRTFFIDPKIRVRFVLPDGSEFYVHDHMIDDDKDA